MKRFTLPLVFLAVSPLVAAAQDIEKFLAQLAPRVYPAGSEAAKQAPLLFGKFLKAERDRVNQGDVKAWQDLAAKNDRAAWEKFIAPRIANLKQSLGSFPALDGLEPPSHVTKTLAGDGFAIDNLVYESRPGLWVTANLYRPHPLPQSAPAILIVHSHHNGKTQGELQDMGVTWARAGCYVLIPDQLGHGERRQHPFVDEKGFPQPFKVGRQDYYFRYNLGIQLHLVGESLMGWMANDMIAGVNLMLKKPNVDPARIILLGSVAGGGDPATVTAALDKRIACLVPFNFGGPQPETKFPLPDDAETSFNYFGSGSWESTRNLADSAPGGFLPWAIVASIAPRRLIHAHEFAWDGDRDPVWKRYQKVWGWYGVADRLGVAHGKGTLSGKPPDATHCNNIGAEHRAMIHPYFKKWFGISIPENEAKSRFGAAELACWTPELRDKLKPKKAHELAWEHWETQRPVNGLGGRLLRSLAAKFETPWEESHSKERRFTGTRTKVATASAEEPKNGVVVRRVLLRCEDLGLEIPIVVLEPVERTESRIVIAVSKAGKQAFLNERRREIAGLLKSGMAVCLPDLWLTGETAQSSVSRGRASAATSTSSTVRMLGSTVADLQSECLRQVVSHLATDAAKRKRSLEHCLWFESFAPTNGPNVPIATPFDVDPAPALAEPMGVSAFDFYWHASDKNCRGILNRGGLTGFGSVLKSQYLWTPHDAIETPKMPFVEVQDAALSVFRGAKKSNAAVPAYRFEGMVDALNRPVSQADVDRGLARFREEFGETNRMTFRAERGSADDVVTWFANCFK